MQKYWTHKTTHFSAIISILFGPFSLSLVVAFFVSYSFSLFTFFVHPSRYDFPTLSLCFYLISRPIPFFPFSFLLLSPLAMFLLPKLKEAHHACQADGAHHTRHHHRPEGGREDAVLLVMLILESEEGKRIRKFVCEWKSNWFSISWQNMCI